MKSDLHLRKGLLSHFNSFNTILIQFFKILQFANFKVDPRLYFIIFIKSLT